MYQVSRSHIQFPAQMCLSTLVAGVGAAVFLFAAVMADSGPVLAQSAAVGLATGDRPPGSPFSGFRSSLQPPVPELKALLEPGDEVAVLEAIDVALTQAGDGATYVWRHANGRLNGAVHMTRTFRGVDGRMCRQLQMLLNSGTFSRKHDGIACRQRDGAWELEG